MQFKFVVSKLANFYFFIANLSEWHFSCRKDYNEEWMKIIGKLTPREKILLEKFRKISQKYNFSSPYLQKTKYLGKYFYLLPQNICWQQLKKCVTASEFETIRETFDIFRPKFEKIWRKSQTQGLKTFKQELRKNKWQNLFQDLEMFLGKGPEILNVIIVFSPLKGNGVTAAGNAMLGYQNLILELPALKKNSWELNYSICILAHEVAHVLFEKNNGRKLIRDALKDEKMPHRFKNCPLTTENLINEIVAESLVPYGYLAQKYSDFKLIHCLFNPLAESYKEFQNFQRTHQINYYRYFIRYIVWILMPLTIIYLNNSKKIEKDYIQKIVQTIKKG